MMVYPHIDALRQKPPFRYLDNVVSFDHSNKTIVTKVAPVSSNERFWPVDLDGGYLWIEAMAQSCGLLLMATKKASRGYLVAIEQLHFFRSSADLLEGELHVRAVNYSPPYYMFSAQVVTQAETVVQGLLKIFAD